jgi:hypothetical protein
MGMVPASSALRSQTIPIVSETVPVAAAPISMDSATHGHGLDVYRAPLPSHPHRLRDCSHGLRADADGLGAHPHIFRASSDILHAHPNTLGPLVSILQRTAATQGEPFGEEIMSDPKRPVPGDMHIDATDVQVTDITPEQIKGLTKLHDGYEDAVRQVLNLKPEDVARAGINPAEIARLGDAFAADTRIGELLPSSEKMTELLGEARLLRRHDIGTILGEIASQARRRADHSPAPGEILGPVDKVIAYQYGPAAKAVATKEKAKKAKKGGGGGEGPPTS